jgi:hypothetical protein
MLVVSVSLFHSTVHTSQLTLLELLYLLSKSELSNLDYWNNQFRSLNFSGKRSLANKTYKFTVGHDRGTIMIPCMSMGRWS